MEWLLEYQLPFRDRNARHWLGLAQTFDIAGKAKAVFWSVRVRKWSQDRKWSYHIRSKITERWLAETEGIFSSSRGHFW